MSIERRIEELERHTGAGKQVVIWVTYEGEPEPTEAQKEAAIAGYKAKNPNWKEGDFIVLYWRDGRFQEKHRPTYPRGSRTVKKS